MERAASAGERAANDVHQNGRQYVVIAAGGHDRLHTTSGDYVLAYTFADTPMPDTTVGRSTAIGGRGAPSAALILRMAVTLRNVATIR